MNGVNAITKLWVMNIVNGNKTFNEVPDKLKDNVRAVLLQLGRGDLITE